MSRLGALFLRPTSEFMITQEEETAKSDCGGSGAPQSLGGVGAVRGILAPLYLSGPRKIKF